MTSPTQTSNKVTSLRNMRPGAIKIVATAQWVSSEYIDIHTSLPSRKVMLNDGTGTIKGVWAGDKQIVVGFAYEVVGVVKFEDSELGLAISDLKLAGRLLPSGHLAEVTQADLDDALRGRSPTGKALKTSVLNKVAFGSVSAAIGLFSLNSYICNQGVDYQECSASSSLVWMLLIGGCLAIAGVAYGLGKLVE